MGYAFSLHFEELEQSAFGVVATGLLHCLCQPTLPGKEVEEVNGKQERCVRGNIASRGDVGITSSVEESCGQGVCTGSASKVNHYVARHVHDAA